MWALSEVFTTEFLKYLVPAVVTVGAYYYLRSGNKAGSSDKTKAPRIVIPNKEEYNRKRKKIIAAGKDKLLVLTDFDQTLTRYWITKPDGSRERSSPTHGVLLSKEANMPASYKERTTALLNKYYPHEIDPNLPLEKKIPLMEAWWNGAHDLLIEYGATAEKIRLGVRGMKFKMREGASELLDTLKEMKVPAVIMSAGIGNVIVEILKMLNLYYPTNQTIVANMIQYSKDGTKIEGFSELIHTFNKHSRYAGTDFWHTHRNRRNIILLGDSAGDSQMADGLEFNEILKVAFLNVRIESRLPEFKKKYDVIILNDGNMEIVTDILREM